jgi:ubiquinone/menaquinone biosynthesis C-methylase UbiE
MVAMGKMLQGMFELGESAPWRERFIAWWEGVELEPELDFITSETLISEDEGGEAAEDGENGGTRFAEKMAAKQQIWGKGFDAPGTHEFAFEMFQSLNLTKGQEVLELGGALGGIGRALAEEFFVSVTTLVTSMDVAQIAMAQTTDAGLDNKVRFAPFNPDHMGLRSGKYNCIYGREALFRIEDKETLLDQAEKALIPGGHLLLFDYSLPDEGEQGAELEAWAKEEDSPTHLVKGTELVDMLQKRHFAVLTQEDVTDEYYRMILDGWVDCVRTVKKMKILGDLTDRFILDLLDEAEQWGNRAAILKSGNLRYLRIHAMKSLA